jgi:hypothetical protein
VPAGTGLRVRTLDRAAWMSATIYRFHPDSGFAGMSPADSSHRPSVGASVAASVATSDVAAPIVHDGVVELRFARTTLGEAELRRAVHDLPRPVRELLCLVDQTVAIDQRVSEVHDAQLADAMLLLNLGLIRTVSFDANSATRRGRTPLRPVIDALLSLPSDDLYTLLTQQAKRRLGLLQGFRMVLALERCNGHHEQCALAVRFVQEIWRTHGDAGIRPLRGLLKVI